MTVLIYLVTLLHVFISLFFLKLFHRTKSFLGYVYVSIWLSHYVIGNIFILIARDEIFNNLKFESIAPYYFLALLYGLYFSFIYSLLLLKLNFGTFKVIRSCSQFSLPYLIVFNVLSILFFLLFVSKIGFQNFFSPEMAIYRNILGDYSFVGIGYYYYLAILIIPAMLLIGAYMMDFPQKRNIVIFILFLVIFIVFLLPLGGRGNVINVFLILAVVRWLKNKTFDLTKLFNLKSIFLVSVLILLSVIWGSTRESISESFVTSSSENVEDNLNKQNMYRSLGIDLGRMYIQSYIFYKYSITGTSYGKSYIASILGPFYPGSMLGQESLVGDLSENWSYDTIGVTNSNSAMSPSFIGEFFINFGLIGLVIAPFVFFFILFFFKALFVSNIFLNLSVFILYFQFMFFHGGLYSLFDIIWLLLPIFIYNWKLSNS
jgi:oligosaccharide repeat unit polymerase